MKTTTETTGCTETLDEGCWCEEREGNLNVRTEDGFIGNRCNDEN